MNKRKTEAHQTQGEEPEKGKEAPYHYCLDDTYSLDNWEGKVNRFSEGDEIENTTTTTLESI